MVDSNKNGNLLIIIIIALVAVVAGVYFLQSDGNTEQTKLENAVDEFREADTVGEGIEEAEDELRGDEPTSEKVGEAIEEVGEDIEEATDGDGK